MPFQGSKSNVVILNPQIPFGADTTHAFSALSKVRNTIPIVLQVFVG